jgi:hypothetical protein
MWTDETFGIEGYESDVPAESSECGAGVDHMLRHITGSLSADALGKDGGLRHVEFKPGILLEDVLEISQDLERRAHHLGFDVPIVSKSKRRACGYLERYVPVSGGWSD